MIPKNKSWEVVKHSASPKKTFFFGVITPSHQADYTCDSCHFSGGLPMHSIISSPKGHATHAYLFSIESRLTLVQKGGGGGGGMCLKLPSTYVL